MPPDLSSNCDNAHTQTTRTNLLERAPAYLALPNGKPPKSGINKTQKHESKNNLMLGEPDVIPLTMHVKNAQTQMANTNASNY